MSRHKVLSVILTILFFLPVTAHTDQTISSTNIETTAVAANPTTGEQIKWQVISGGGTKGASTSYALNGTIGQTATGTGNSTNYRLNQGFWQSFSCCLKAGDANNDTKVNVGDAVFVINYVFKAGAAPTCKDQGDANADGKVNVGDAVYLINYVFKAGAAPKCP